MKKEMFQFMRKFFATALSMTLMFYYLPGQASAQEATEVIEPLASDGPTIEGPSPEQLEKLMEIVEASDADENLKKELLGKLEQATTTGEVVDTEAIKEDIAAVVESDPALAGELEQAFPEGIAGAPEVLGGEQPAVEGEVTGEAKTEEVIEETTAELPALEDSEVTKGEEIVESAGNGGSFGDGSFAPEKIEGEVVESQPLTEEGTAEEIVSEPTEVLEQPAETFAGEVIEEPAAGEIVEEAKPLIEGTSEVLIEDNVAPVVGATEVLEGPTPDGLVIDGSNSAEGTSEVLAEGEQLDAPAQDSTATENQDTGETSTTEVAQNEPTTNEPATLDESKEQLELPLAEVRELQKDMAELAQAEPQLYQAMTEVIATDYQIVVTSEADDSQALDNE